MIEQGRLHSDSYLRDLNRAREIKLSEPDFDEIAEKKFREGFRKGWTKHAALTIDENTVENIIMAERQPDISQASQAVRAIIDKKIQEALEEEINGEQEK